MFSLLSMSLQGIANKVHLIVKSQLDSSSSFKLIHNISIPRDMTRTCLKASKKKRYITFHQKSKLNTQKLEQWEAVNHKLLIEAPATILRHFIGKRWLSLFKVELNSFLCQEMRMKGVNK